MQFGLGIPGFVLLALAISLAAGIIVGYAYRLLQVPTLIVSIGLMLIMESVTRIIYGGAGIHFTLPYMTLGRFPYNLGVFAIAFAAAWALYYKRKLGYAIRAVGSNPTVAQTNGINPVNTKVNALIASGLFAGLFTILSTSATGVTAAVPGTMGSVAMVFDAMMCVLIGMAIAGRGSMVWAIYSGAIVTQILKMWMMAIGLPTTYNKVVIGMFVVLFMVASSRSDVFTKIRNRLKPVRASA
jgi:ribose transport system permease protein